MGYYVLGAVAAFDAVPVMLQKQAALARPCAVESLSASDIAALPAWVGRCPKYCLGPGHR